jgi:hypothetical protein
MRNDEEEELPVVQARCNQCGGLLQSRHPNKDDPDQSIYVCKTCDRKGFRDHTAPVVRNVATSYIPKLGPKKKDPMEI